MIDWVIGSLGDRGNCGAWCLVLGARCSVLGCWGAGVRLATRSVAVAEVELVDLSVPGAAGLCEHHASTGRVVAQLHRAR